MNHAAQITTPLTGPYVWTRRELEDDKDWLFVLSDRTLREIDDRLAELRAGDIGIDGITAQNFALPSLAPDIARINAMLLGGRGLAQIRGLDRSRYDDDDFGRIFCGLGAALGVSVSQSYKGDRLGHVRDIGEAGRYYTIGGALEMHMDPVDVVGLLCLKTALRGGESRIASSNAVHNAIAAERPDLMPVFYRGFHYSSRAADRTADSLAYSPHRIPVFGDIEDMPACFLLPQAIRNAAESEGVVMSAEELEALEFIDEVARRPELRLGMELAEGDVQFLNNRLVLHGREDYDDPPDPAGKRHLLRLWLMIPDWPARPEWMNFHGANDRALGGIAAHDGAAR